MKLINPDIVLKNYDLNKDYFIDVRTKQEFEEGHADIENIVNIEFLQGEMREINHNFLNEIKELVVDKNANIYLFCKTATRSGYANDILLENGFENSFNINGGKIGNDNHTGWIKNNLKWVGK